MKSRLLIVLITICLLPISSCKKQTYNKLLGKWDRQMVNYTQNATFGHRNLIGQQWDFRDFKYVFIISTLSGQVGAGPGVSLDSLPTIETERRRYEVTKYNKLTVTYESSGQDVYYDIIKLNSDVLRINIMENGVVGDSFDFVRSKEQ